MTAGQVDGKGPLAGVSVVELAGLGPAPFTTMMLADMGADVVRVDRPPTWAGGSSPDLLARGRRSIALNLKNPDALEILRALVDRADVLVEGFRPGVTERLGLGPDLCLERNPRLVYGRMTGWGQTGPMAPRAGHDIDYIALAGALHPVGDPTEPPPVPINYVGDFGGGGMLLAFGIACALVERATSGRGQVVDAAMVDGAALQTAMLHGLMAMGLWTDQRGANTLDGAAPYYRCYRCADDRFVAVGALEPQFYAELMAGLALDAAEWPQGQRERWPDLAKLIAERFATRSRDEWAEHFASADACVAPVLSLTEAPADAHLRARATFVEADGVQQPAPAPRFSRTPGALSRPPVLPGQHTDEVLGELGMAHAVSDLRAAGAIG